MGGSKQYIPFSQRLVRGAIGKKYVIKHYKYGIVKTKFPDMTTITASDRQRAWRDKFKALNTAVKAIYNDLVQREEWRRKLGNPPHLYAAIFKVYRKGREEVKLKRTLMTNRAIGKCFAAVTPGNTVCRLQFTIDEQKLARRWVGNAINTRAPVLLNRGCLILLHPCRHTRVS